MSNANDDRRVYFRPYIRMAKKKDGTWHVDFDFSDSCEGEFDEATGREIWNDFAEAACNAFDRWAKAQPLMMDGVDIPDHYIQEEPV